MMNIASDVRYLQTSVILYIEYFLILLKEGYIHLACANFNLHYY